MNRHPGAHGTGADGAVRSVFLRDADTTAALAEVLADTRPGIAVVHLHGDLGAGKSTLARAWLRALGVVGAIRSPTYTLVERYPLNEGGEALHLDLYRIGDAGELGFLGLDDIDVRLWLVEWAGRGREALPPPDLDLTLGLEGSGRRADLRFVGPAGREWVARLDEDGRLREFPEPPP